MSKNEQKTPIVLITSLYEDLKGRHEQLKSSFIPKNVVVHWPGLFNISNCGVFQGFVVYSWLGPWSEFDPSTFNNTFFAVDFPFPFILFLAWVVNVLKIWISRNEIEINFNLFPIEKYMKLYVRNILICCMWGFICCMILLYRDLWYLHIA